MTLQRIVLLDSSSQLLNELFRRVIVKQPGIELVDEVEDVEQLSDVIEETGTDWVIHLESKEEDSTQNIRSLAFTHPATRFLTIAVTENKICLRQIKVEERELRKRTSFKEILSMIAGVATPSHSAHQDT